MLLVAMSFLIYTEILGVKEVSIKNVVENSAKFNGMRVKLSGYIINITNVYMFGPKYFLRDHEEKVEIALNIKGEPEKINLEPYISFVFNGENYTKIRDIKVTITGIVHYVGQATDAPLVTVNIENIKPQINALKTIIIQFLNTTDVAKGGLYGEIEILELYEQKLGGHVVLVAYITRTMGHPHFILEALESHTAIITLNQKSEVISAYCLHRNKIWDLINQKWVNQTFTP